MNGLRNTDNEGVLPSLQKSLTTMCSLMSYTGRFSLHPLFFFFFFEQLYSSAHGQGKGFLSSWVIINDKISSFELSTILSHFYLLVPDIGIMVRVFANGPGDPGSIPGRVLPKTLKMVLDATLLNTQHYKVRIKGKVEQSRETSSTLPYTLV